MNASEYITGMQHIGLPTRDMQATLAFYQGLGFSIDWKIELEGKIGLAFLKLGDCVFETFINPNAVGVPGAIDHIALNVTDVEKVYEAIVNDGSYTICDPEKGIQFLPFYNGVKFFTILGPNGEKVEFNQKL